MADFTQSFFSVEEQLKSRGIQARVDLTPTDGREADPEVVSHLQGEEPSEWNKGLRRRFLRRLTLALVTFGSSAPRTEYLIQSAAERLNVKTTIAVLNSLVFLLFPNATDVSMEEIHILKVASSMDVDKLQRIDELANSVGLSETPLMMGQWQLQTIVNAPSSFGSWYWQLLGFVLTAPTAALLFFSGNYWDAIFSLFLGLVVGIISLLEPILPGFGNVVEFVAALAVSFLARLFSFYFAHLEVCYFAMTISGLVWLLPGQNLTIGVSEVVEGAIMTGTARAVRALVSALLLGFGLMIGEQLVWWVPKLEPTPCDDPDISSWFLIIWLHHKVIVDYKNTVLCNQYEQGNHREVGPSVLSAIPIPQIPCRIDLSGTERAAPIGFESACACSTEWDALLGFVFAANMLLRARLGQWLGMTLVAGIGYVVYELSEGRFGAETAAVLSSFAIGLTATFLSFIIRDIPLSMVMAGIQVLLPGGIGVQGVDILMKDDVLSGISFVMNMIIICLSITVGLLLSKAFIHDGFLGATKIIPHNHQTLPNEFHEDEQESMEKNEHEEDQQMAI